MIVVEASVCAAWLLPDENDASSWLTLDALASGEAFVPTIFPVEIRNVVLVAWRRKRLTDSQFETLLESLPLLLLVVDTDADMGDVVTLAAANGLSAYDALYLELALRRSLPLATHDRRLRAAAASAGVAVA